jgi:cyclophilin family peptidyl-prolyl cis-trans isomerase
LSLKHNFTHHMDTTPEASPRFPWLTLIVVIIVILAGIQWWSMRSRGAPPVLTEAYSIETATTVTASPSTSTNQQTSGITSTTTNIEINNLMHTITIETNKGTIVFETYDADAPKTAENFVTLAQKGFYDGVIFHRIIEGFMIQGGDPTGTGSGGPGYKFADELNPATDSYQKGYVRGTVAMANSGPNTNGSQFFIMHKDTPLPHAYTIFGRVISGMEVVDAIATTPVGPGDRPLSDVVMKKVTVKTK